MLNLLLLFSLVPAIVTQLPLGAFTEEMFEVVAAYFPIDFVPVSPLQNTSVPNECTNPIDLIHRDNH